MELLILFLLATIGLTNILVHGVILDEIKIFKSSIREWLHSIKFIEKVLSCYECTGAWAGLGTGVITLLSDKFPWLKLLLFVFAGSVVSAFYSEFIFMIRSKTDFVVEDDNGNKQE